jgi:hypothetical protein
VLHREASSSGNLPTIYSSLRRSQSRSPTNLRSRRSRQIHSLRSLQSRRSLQSLRSLYNRRLRILHNHRAPTLSDCSDQSITTAIRGDCPRFHRQQKW